MDGWSVKNACVLQIADCVYISHIADNPLSLRFLTFSVTKTKIHNKYLVHNQYPMHKMVGLLNITFLFITVNYAPIDILILVRFSSHFVQGLALNTSPTENKS